MPLKTDTMSKYKYVEEIHVYDATKPDEKHKAYKINKRKKEIFFYPRDESSHLKEIRLLGFDELPEEFSKKGHIKAGVLYYLNKKLEGKRIKELRISKTEENSFKKDGNGYRVILNYTSFKKLKDKLARINYETKQDKSKFVDGFFHNLFPRRYKKPNISAGLRVKKVLNNLDDTIIEHLSGEDVEKLLSFFESLIAKKYKSASHRRKLFQSAKIKVDDIAITEIISDFEKMLAGNHSEATWGDYLKKNIFLVDSKYVKVIPELNVVLAGYRKADFGLVDSQGYMDIFEIKKPTTPLLAKTRDRGNYYWSTDAVKALVQAEKYLYNAERKAPSLTEDIKREKKLTVEVIKPRAIIIIGNSDQLDDEDKRKDFRILRMSLKNIEVVLYDELLQRLKSQKDKIYID